MPRVFIDDLDDPRLAVYHQLKRSNLTRDRSQFIVEGEKLFDRLAASRFPLRSVLAADRHEARIAGRVPAEVPLYVVPNSLLSVLVGFNFHRGVLACGRRLSWPPLAEMLPAGDRRSTIVICPTLNNPENLGAIIRIADVFGVDAVLVGGSCPDPLSRRVLRVSMGTSLRLPVIESDDLDGDVTRLRDDLGFTLVASVLDAAAIPLERMVRPRRLALFLGSESEGLEARWTEACNTRVTIPMRAGAESLNVAVAAGILLYQLTRGGEGLDRS